MNNIEKYIDFFKACIGNDKAGEIVVQEGQLPYYKYHNEVSNFIKDFYDSDLIDYNYSNNIAKINLLALPNDKTSLNDLKTILTNILRKDRFSEGFLYKNIKDGSIYLLLELINKKRNIAK